MASSFRHRDALTAGEAKKGLSEFFPTMTSIFLKSPILPEILTKTRTIAFNSREKRQIQEITVQIAIN